MVISLNRCYMCDEIGYFSSGESKFNNKSHVSNHLNYLFRTDKSQKWTNNFTQFNYFVRFKDGKLMHGMFPEKLEDRLVLKEDLKLDIFRELEVDNLNMIMFNINVNNKIVSIDEMLEAVSVEDLLKNLLDFYSAVIFIDKDLFPVALVAHFDQINPHFHLIFSNYSDCSLFDALTKNS